MNYSDEMKKTIASSRAFLKNISDDELEVLMQELYDYEVEICKQYGVDYSKELPKGVTFLNCKDAECKFINELIKHNENI